MSDAMTQTARDRVDPGEYLTRQKILVEQADDLVLAASVRRDWEERLERFRADGSDEANLLDPLATLLEIPVASITIEPVSDSDRVSVRVDGNLVGQWVSFAGVAADVTASEVLRTAADGWASIDAANKGTVLSTLRMFVPSCPLCGANVSLQETGCCCGCDGDDAYMFACESTDCGAITYRINKDTADAFL